LPPSFGGPASEPLAGSDFVRGDKTAAECCQAVLPGTVCQETGREVTMKRVFASVAALTLFLIAVTLARAETCSGRAQACVVKWGSPRAACFEQFRLAACEKTGKYVAPNGNIWPASRGKKTGIES
jgi:hypothetical protein